MPEGCSEFDSCVFFAFWRSLYSPMMIATAALSTNMRNSAVTKYFTPPVSIHPTGVNTPMNDGLAAMEGATPIEIAERSAGYLLPVPWIEAEDLAELVLYLASERARFATGAQFTLDAGLLSR